MHGAWIWTFFHFFLFWPLALAYWREDGFSGVFPYLRRHMGLSLHGRVIVSSLEFLREVSTQSPTISIPGFLRGGPRRRRRYITYLAFEYGRICGASITITLTNCFLVLLVYVYVYTNTTDFLFCLIFHVPPESRCREEGAVTFYVPEDDAIDSRWRLSWADRCSTRNMPWVSHASTILFHPASMTDMDQRQQS